MKHKIEILSSDGWKTFDGVLDNGVQDTLLIEFSDGSNIECTSDHLIWNGDKFIMANEIHIGCDIDGLKVLNIQNSGMKNVYDALNVADVHDYYTNNVISHNCLYVDEAAFIPSKIADEFFASIFPTLSSSKTSQLLLSSTPQGFNHFYDFWVGAINKTNNFVPYKTEWDCVPGRDEEWLEEQRKLLGRIKFNQEVLCSFLGSSDTLIDGSALERHYNQAKETVPIYESSEDEPVVTIFEKVNRNHIYFIVVDTSKGGGGDYQVATVFDISVFPYKIVEVYRSNLTGDTEMPTILNELGLKYNNAYMLVEVNKSDKIAYSLWSEYEYENLLAVVKNDKGRWILRPARSSDLGVTTNARIKKDGCSNARKIAEEDQIIVNYYELAKEMRTFVFKNGSYKAEDTYKDDVMMTFVLFAWCTTQEFFKDLAGKTLDFLENEQLKNEEEFIGRSVVYINDDVPDGLRRVDYLENNQMTEAEEFFFGKRYR